MRRRTMAELDADEDALRALGPEVTTAAELELWQSWLNEIACERWIVARRQYAEPLRRRLALGEWFEPLDAGVPYR